MFRTTHKFEQAVCDYHYNYVSRISRDTINQSQNNYSNNDINNEQLMSNGV